MNLISPEVIDVQAEASPEVTVRCPGNVRETECNSQTGLTISSLDQLEAEIAACIERRDNLFFTVSKNTEDASACEEYTRACRDVQSMRAQYDQAVIGSLLCPTQIVR